MNCRFRRAVGSLVVAAVACVGSTASAEPSPAGAAAPPYRPGCGPTAEAPRYEPAVTGNALVSIPANAPALLFKYESGGGTVDTVTLKSETANDVATTSRESDLDTILLRLTEPLRAGETYSVQATSMCQPSSRPNPVPVARFIAGEAATLPTEMGKVLQLDDTLGGTSVPVLALELSAEARPFLPLTRFTVRIPNDPFIGESTRHGGTLKPAAAPTVHLASLSSFCRANAAAPTQVAVSAYLAGESVPYATVIAPIDIGAFCTEQERVRAENERRNAEAAAAAQAAATSPDDRAPASRGGCSLAATAPSNGTGTSGGASVALAAGLAMVVASALRRRR